MMMVIGEPVNSWGGGHAGTPGASRATGCLANISTSLLLGQESEPVAAAVVNCESPVSHRRRPLQQSANSGVRIASQGGTRESSRAFRTAFLCVYRGWTTSHDANQPAS